MGRGLSELQKNILRLAYQNRQEALKAYAEAQAHQKEQAGRVRIWDSYQKVKYLATVGPDVCPHHILGELYGFSEHTIKGWDGKPRDWSWLRDELHGQKFDLAAIGQARYNAATVATSKALERLEQRGLLIEAGWGYRLTEEGLEVAESLMSLVEGQEKGV